MGSIMMDCLSSHFDMKDMGEAHIVIGIEKLKPEVAINLSSK